MSPANLCNKVGEYSQLNSGKFHTTVIRLLVGVLAEHGYAAIEPSQFQSQCPASGESTDLVPSRTVLALCGVLRLLMVPGAS